MNRTIKVFTTLLLTVFFAATTHAQQNDPASANPSKTSQPAAKVVNGHEYVDLGLPSGLLWARTNVGAATPYDDGDYFAWGETQPKDKYTEDNYKLCHTYDKMNHVEGMTKRVHDYLRYTPKDGKTTLGATDDVATVKWGKECRMPSLMEFKELFENCALDWKANYHGTNGYLLTGPNGNTLFMPASGCYSLGRSVIGGKGAVLYLWSSSLYTKEYERKPYEYAHIVMVLKSEISLGPNFRYDGLPVRPVANK